LSRGGHLMTETSEIRMGKGFPLEPLRKRHDSAWKYPGASGSPEELLVFLLFRASIKLQKTFDRCFVRFRMTAQDAAVLIRCVEAGEISARRLADIMSRDKGKITRFVDRLEAGNFLVRKSNPRDHRSLVIKATSRGRRVAPRLKVVFEEIRKQFFAGVSANDIDQLGSVLSQMCANADFLYQRQAARDRRRDKTHADGGLPGPQGERE
jgi:DNA-binding MarR family transcriptional regulator